MVYGVLLTYIIKCALDFLSVVRVKTKKQSTNIFAHATRMKSIKILLRAFLSVRQIRVHYVFRKTSYSKLPSIYY